VIRGTLPAQPLRGTLSSDKEGTRGKADWKRRGRRRKAVACRRIRDWIMGTRIV